jgi:RES domain-containing protein
MDSPFNRSLRAFRIGRAKHPLMDGSGAARFGGRWNEKGQKIIYAAECYSGALLETLAHVRMRWLPPDLAWIKIEIAAEIAREVLNGEDLRGWDAPDYGASRVFGSRWCQERRTAVLLVPSVTTAGIEHNLLINQEHPDFTQIVASSPAPVIWDERFL